MDVVQIPYDKHFQQYPPPLIVDATGQHQQSLIILHGRGSNAVLFAPDLLDTPLPDGITFRDVLPHTKFVFPTASLRTATMSDSIPSPQWFDMMSPNDPSRPDLECEGLRESCAYVHELLQQEIDLVGAENVVLGGLSQGCAITLTSLLLWTGKPLRAAFGMSGWLPFQHMLYPTNDSDQEEDDKKVAGSTRHVDSGGQTAYNKAVCRLREELELPTTSAKALDKLETPIFLGHGAADETVLTRVGEAASDCLRALGCTVSWHTYEHLEHWYHGLELQHVVSFIMSAV